MPEKIAITGSNGTIGTVLKEGLSGEFDIQKLDLPELDVRDLNQVVKGLKGSTAVIHLAWNGKTENYLGGYDPDNFLMAMNVYKTAKEAGVKRVIVASSVHADNFYEWQGPGFMSPNKTPDPQMPYGEDKVNIENEGREFAKLGLEVVCVRIGGINPKNEFPVHGKPADLAAWLSHDDCISLFRAILKAEKIPDN